MFVLRSKYADLQARHNYTVEELAKARKELTDWKGSAILVAGRNGELQRRLVTAREAFGDDAEYAHQLEKRVERLAKAAGRYLAALWTARADVRKLTRQAEVDKGVMADLSKRLGLAEQRARETDAWERRPADGAPALRDESLAGQLRRSQEHARALDKRLGELTMANQRCTCQRWEALS